MSSLTAFIVAILAVAAALILYVFKSPRKALDYFKTKDGKGVAKGIVLALLIIIGIATGSKVFGADYLDYAEVYLGIDHTKSPSPQCDETPNNEYLTSNAGIRLNLLVSDDRKFHLNTKYTHHSCAFNPDRENYDAFGVEVVYRLW